MAFDNIVWEKPYTAEYLLKTANTDLSGDVTTWMSKIRSAFEKQHPALISSGAHPYISFENKDMISGNAVGAVTATAHGTYMMFPMIIEEKVLAPFDVVYIKGNWYYADDELISSISNKYSLFDGTRTPDDSSIHRTEYYDKKISLANYCPVTEKHRDIIKKFIEKNANFYANAGQEFKDRIKDIASGKFDKKAEANSINASDYDVVKIQHDDINLYNVKLSAYGMNGYVETEMRAPEVRKLAADFEFDAEGVMDAADYDPHKSVMIQRYKVKPIESSAYPPAGLVYSYGTYRVMFDSGEREYGVVLPTIDWNFHSTTKKLFLGNQHWAFQEQIFGSPSSRTMIAPKGNLSPCAEGVFTYEKNGKRLATPPFRIVSIANSADGLSVIAEDMMTQKKLNLVLVPNIKSIMRLGPEDLQEAYEPDAINLMIPSDMKFSPLPPVAAKVVADPQDLNKIGSPNKVRIQKISDDCFIVDSDLGSSYPDRIEKLAGFSKFDKLDRGSFGDTVFHLVTFGFDKEAAIAMCRKQDERIVSVDCPKASSHKFIPERIINEEEKKASTVFNTIDIDKHLDRVSILKIASILTDGDSLDKIFNLEFFDKDTISFFSDKMELLNEAESVLAKLLLSARISSIGISDDEIKRTLEGLSYIRRSFKGLIDR